MKIEDINSKKPVRIILSGGGTAGHIHPAVAVAERIEAYYGKDAEVLFVGAKGKMEMDKVSKLGYNIVGLPITGFQRRFTFKNLLLPFKILASLYLARRIVRRFRPQIVLGFGGYASAPIIKAAQTKSIATMIWEGNSFAGMANKLIGKNVQRVFVAYDNMDRFFEKEKIVLSGNPLRCDFSSLNGKETEADKYFGFDQKRPTLLVTGGSLGTRTFNEAILKYFDKIVENSSYNVIWQTGSYYYEQIKSKVGDRKHPNIWISPFIDRMDYAYALADLTVGRAGASTISELALINMPSIIIPSPNVADDHQRKNAISLVERNAVVMIEDKDAIENLIPEAEKVLFDEKALRTLKNNIEYFAQSNSADIILNELKKFVIL